jgi:PmbA protein
MSDLLDSARRAVALARDKGATEVAALAYRSRSVELIWRDAKIDKVSDATTRGLNLQLYVDGRYSAVRCVDLRPTAVEVFLDQTIRMARSLSIDPHRHLPDPKRYEGRISSDLSLADPTYASVSAAERRNRAKALEDAVRDLDTKARLISVTSGFGDGERESALVHSNGFEGETRETDFWMDVSATARDPDGRRPQEGASAHCRALDELPGPHELGLLAARRTYDRIGAKKVASAVLPMLVENRSAGRLIAMFLRCLSGRALQQKQSFYERKLGKRVASPVLTLHDEPHLPRGLGSRLWDSDGIAAKRFAVVDAGVLRSYYIDNYYGRKLGRPPTTGTASNLVFSQGKQSAQELLASIPQGMMVTGFLGGNSNDTTGDFSLGVQGFVIRDGERAEPFSEMNISGNQGALWNALAALGDDPYPHSDVRVPTLLFDGVQFSGV